MCCELAIPALGRFCISLHNHEVLNITLLGFFQGAIFHYMSQIKYQQISLPFIFPYVESWYVMGEIMWVAHLLISITPWPYYEWLRQNISDFQCLMTITRHPGFAILSGGMGRKHSCSLCCSESQLRFCEQPRQWRNSVIWYGCPMLASARALCLVLK